MGRIERIVLHIPHASPVLPFGRSGWDAGIGEEIARWTDWHTGWLFGSSSLADPRIVPVAYPFSRFFCDVERLEDDPLEAVGQGKAYRRFGTFERTLSEEELDFALGSYAEHRKRLVGALSSGGPETLLVDCHSFPADLSDVDVCIGVNDDWSRPDDALIERVVGHFISRGYSTAVNEPYSNSVSPEAGFRYASLMIELNKRTYLQGISEMDMHKALSIRRCIEEYYQSVLGTEDVDSAAPSHNHHRK